MFTLLKTSDYFASNALVSFVVPDHVRVRSRARAVGIDCAAAPFGYRIFLLAIFCEHMLSTSGTTKNGNTLNKTTFKALEMQRF